MFSQSEMERELYEGRLKAKRDAQTRETLIQQSLEKIAELEQHRAKLDQRLEELDQRRVESDQRRVESEHRLGKVERERDEAIQALKSTLVGQIQLCERLLGREATDSDELERRDEETLRALAQHLERELAELR